MRQGQVIGQMDEQPKNILPLDTAVSGAEAKKENSCFRETEEKVVVSQLCFMFSTVVLSGVLIILLVFLLINLVP